MATNVRHMTPDDIEEEIEKILADWKTRLSVTEVVDYIKDAAQVCIFVVCHGMFQILYLSLAYC
jgi:hypothetical protein